MKDIHISYHTIKRDTFAAPMHSKCNAPDEQKLFIQSSGLIEDEGGVDTMTLTIHVLYICLHLADFYGFHVGK